MFNLNKKINAWKKSLHKNPSFEEGYIEELESHLRDLIEEKIKTGLAEEEAFKYAVNKIGETEVIGDEYYKTDTTNKVSGRPSWKAPRWMPDLVWNYFKVAVRNIKKYKSISFINIFGLSIGIASVLLIAMIVLYEMSFDNFNENKERLYRVYTEVNRPEGKFVMAPVMFPLAPLAKDEIPEIQHAVRLSDALLLISYGENRFYESVRFADENIFNVFTIPMKYGDKDNALKEINTIAISEKIAEKYFGKENPVGKTLLINNRDNYTVSGVFYDIPANSSFTADIFVSMETLIKNGFSRIESWGGFGNDYTYFLLKNKFSAKTVEDKLEEVINRHTDKDLIGRYKLKLENISSVHFSDIEYDNSETTPILFLYIFSAVAVFILLIACINFVNLTTARSARRGKEVGIRKVAGATRFQLVKQFLSESFVITLISLVVAIGLTYSVIPEINAALKSNLSFSLMLNGNFVLILAALLVITSLAAGLYPAVVLSNAKPVSAIKNELQKNNKGYYLRAVLIVFQFSLSVFLIISTITVYNQAEFLTKHNPGFNTEQILVVPIYNNALMENPDALKNTLLRDSRILNLSFSDGAPASGSSSTSNFGIEGRSDEDEVQIQVIAVDYNFMETYGLQIVSGRNFSKEFISDENETYLINEAAAKKFGLQSPIGKKIRQGDGEFRTIAGVVKDFNYTSLRDRVPPVVFKLNPGGSRFLSMLINKEHAQDVVDFVKKSINELFPGYPVEYYFMNERFESYYKAERTIGKLLSAFSILAVIISCIGILGLVSFVAEQKSKEIGIRKVLGASVNNILLLIGKQFIKWIIVSNIIVWPLAYLFLDNWLNSFAYRVEINYFVFAGTLAASVLITFLTMGYHTLKAAFSNPVNSLRSE